MSFKSTSIDISNETNKCYINDEKVSILPCLLVEERLEFYVGVEIFPKVFKVRGSKQNDIVELWKFSLKMGSR